MAKKISDRSISHMIGGQRKLTANEFGWMIGRILLTAIGALLATVMFVVVLYGIGANDFFGSCVSLLVVIFGIQLMSIGIRGTTDRVTRAVDADPLEELWNSEKRICPMRPYSNLDIRGR